MESKDSKQIAKLSKQELMDSYQELLKKYKELVAHDKDLQKEARIAEEEITIEKASQYTVENIIKNFAELNIYINKALTDLSDKLTRESSKLNELQKAIEIETKYLSETHQIERNADSLKALLSAHDEEKVTFAETMETKQREWAEEQERHKLEIQERNTIEKKERIREEEEYMYNLSMARKKEQDAYEERKKALEKELIEKKSAFEKDINERIAQISLRESEFAELKKRVEQFPKELDDTVKKSQKEISDKMKTEYESKNQLMSKEIEGERKLLEYKIASLNEAVANQATQIESLNAKLNDSNRQVQDIAIKAIEGASGLKALAAVNEIALEQAKNPSTK